MGIQSYANKVGVHKDGYSTATSMDVDPRKPSY